MTIKKIVLLVCSVLYTIPTFAQASYYLPIGGSLYLHHNPPPNNYSKLNFYVRALNNPRYAAWTEVDILSFNLHNTTNHRTSIDIGFAGRYRHIPQALLGGHIFFIFKSEIEANDVSQSNLPNTTNYVRLKAVNPGIEWTSLKYRTAIYAHAKIQLDPESESIIVKNAWHEALRFQWGGEIVSKTDIPHFSFGSIPMPSTKLTVGVYGKRYAKLEIDRQGELHYPNQPFNYGALVRLEVQLWRFVHLTFHKDQVTPTSVGIQFQYGWQANDIKPMPYYLYNPFDRYLAYHLHHAPNASSTETEDAGEDIALGQTIARKFSFLHPKSKPSQESLRAATPVPARTPVSTRPSTPKKT